MAYDRASTLAVPYYGKYADQEIVHPLYRRYSYRWRFYELFYMGGPEFYEPDLPINWLTPIPPTANAQGDERRQYAARSLKSFLRPHNREEDGDYDQRVLRSARINLCRPIPDLYTSQLYSRKVVREVRAASVWDVVMRDVDLRGSTIDEFMRQAATMAQVFGCVHALVDMSPTPNGTPAATLADQLDFGMRPYVTLIRPLELIDWEVDQFGRFVWVRVIECDPSTYRLRPGAVKSARRIYRTWFRDHWELEGEAYDKDEGHEEPETAGCPYCGHECEGSGPNPLGEVPITTFYRRRIPSSVEPIGISMLAEIAELDMEVFNLISLRQALTHDQGIPIMAVPDPARQTKQIDLLVHRALPYNPTDGGAPPSFVSHDQDAVRIIDEWIDSLIMHIRAVSGLSRGIADQSIAARSGAALLVETNDKAAMLKAFALEAEDFERRLAGMVSRWMGQDFEDDSIRYPDRYDVSTVGDDLVEVKAFLDLDPPAEIQAEVMKAVVGRMLSHLPREQLDALLATLEVEHEKPAMISAAPKEMSKAMEEEEMPAEKMGKDEEVMAEEHGAQS